MIINNDQTYQRTSSGLFFRSSHEVFGAIAELEGVVGELEKQLSVNLNIFKRELRRNDEQEIEAMFISLEDIATKGAEAYVKMASAAKKALASLRLSHTMSQEGGNGNV
jgi:hypothetical protein